VFAFVRIGLLKKNDTQQAGGDSKRGALFLNCKNCQIQKMLAWTMLRLVYISLEKELNVCVVCEYKLLAETPVLAVMETK
jgi:hypothetical protein